MNKKIIALIILLIIGIAVVFVIYKLGTIESGTEILENINEDFEMTIEREN